MGMVLRVLSILFPPKFPRISREELWSSWMPHECIDKIDPFRELPEYASKIGPAAEREVFWWDELAAQKEAA